VLVGRGERLLNGWMVSLCATIVPVKCGVPSRTLWAEYKSKCLPSSRHSNSIFSDRRLESSFGGSASSDLTSMPRDRRA